MSASEALPARSLAEAFLYAMVNFCPECGEGALTAGDAKSLNEGGRLLVDLPVRCGECHRRQVLRFELPPAAAESMRSNKISSEPGASRIIDVAQWLTLFRVITEAADRQKDKVEARRLGYEAAQCLEEALKFFHDDNDLPPGEAFFCDRSRASLRAHPEHFSRQRLVNLRAKLPALGVMERKLEAGDGRKRRRWRWW